MADRKELPKNWVRKESKSKPGRYYYANKQTGVSVWKLEQVFTAEQGDSAAATSSKVIAKECDSKTVGKFKPIGAFVADNKSNELRPEHTIDEKNKSLVSVPGVKSTRKAAETVRKSKASPPQTANQKLLAKNSESRTSQSRYSQSKTFQSRTSQSKTVYSRTSQSNTSQLRTSQLRTSQLKTFQSKTSQSKTSQSDRTEVASRERKTSKRITVAAALIANAKRAEWEEKNVLLKDDTKTETPVQSSKLINVICYFE